ncbi:MAG: FeoB-associated Cys-rich membrane protein [Clostridia bacterium]|nr:FeoB-associated Cys-rich membrane protein [Clostridia bacterium]
MEWFITNLPSIIVFIAVLGLVFGLVYSLVKSKKAGKSSCAGCAMAGKCHGSCATQNNVKTE